MSRSEQPFVTVIGGGLAGCEAALQLARRGIRVVLIEMKRQQRTPAQQSDQLAELVCSSSLRGVALTNAVGLLKEELRLAGSAVLSCALATRVPAGGALAVDRRRFAALMTEQVLASDLIEVSHREATCLPADRPVIVATGPLTSPALASHLAELLGHEHLAYYDAIAPIVSATSIDWSVVWRQSRYDKGDDDSYVNCPLTKEQYRAFVKALVAAEQVPARDFEEARYFEGCLPCEVMAERGEQTLAFGPMKPRGLLDPRTGRRPYAVVQLRPEDEARTAYNLVGFQTRLKHSSQKRVFRQIPGLEQAEFLRLGAVHRNTFINAPELLDHTMQLKQLEGVYITGQLAGVEGYVESTAAGLLCALLLAARLRGRPPELPPATTALGGILVQLRRLHKKLGYQPSNITWSHLPPLEAATRLHKRARYAKLAERALADLRPWLLAMGIDPAAAGAEDLPAG